MDNHPTLAELGIPFFAFGFLPEIFDAPCNNLIGFAKMESEEVRIKLLLCESFEYLQKENMELPV